MKKVLLFILLPLLSIGQSQIGVAIPGEAANDNSSSVSLSSDGTTLAIGAPFNDGNGTNSGSVRVYKNVSGTWTQIGLDIDGEAANDQSGCSVSLSGNGSVLAIGALYNGGNGRYSGSVRVYENRSGTWTKIGADIDGEAAANYSGKSVSLSSDGSILAIGAEGNTKRGYASGTVYVYKNISGTWTQIGADIYGVATYPALGNNVSLSGDGGIVAIGLPSEHGVVSGSGKGVVRVFKNISGIWTQIGVDIEGEANGDNSGWSISLSSDGTILAIGSIFNGANGSGSGSVRVFKNISDTWTQIGTDINGVTTDDFSGRSISISGDGSILVIGADGNNHSGSVRIYKNVSGIWTKVGIDINGEAAYDQSGFNVSLSGNGSVLAIGAPYNDGNGVYSGSVRVYDLSAALAAVLSSDSFVLAKFSVFPNPASEVVTISLQEDLKLEKVNIYNTFGQLVKTEKKTVITVNSLAKGIYFFEVITNKGKATKQIIVK